MIKKILILTFLFLLSLILNSTLAEDKTKETNENPFAFDKIGLPVSIGWCGTCRPSYIDKKEASQIIVNIFKSHGYNLKKNYKIKEADIEFVVSGFDEKHKVGYIYGERANLDEDALSMWYYPREIAGFRKLGSLDDYFGDKYKDDIKKAENIKDKDEREKYLWKLVKEFRKEKSKNALSLSEAKSLSELYRKKKIYIAVISQFDTRFTYDGEVERIIINVEKLAKDIKSSKNKAEEEFIQKHRERDLARLEKEVDKIKKRGRSAAIQRLKKYTKQYLDWVEEEQSKSDK